MLSADFNFQYILPKIFDHILLYCYCRFAIKEIILTDQSTQQDVTLDEGLGSKSFLSKFAPSKNEKAPRKTTSSEVVQKSEEKYSAVRSILNGKDPLFPSHTSTMKAKTDEAQPTCGVRVKKDNHDVCNSRKSTALMPSTENSTQVHPVANSTKGLMEMLTVSNDTVPASDNPNVIRDTGRGQGRGKGRGRGRGRGRARIPGPSQEITSKFPLLAETFSPKILTEPEIISETISRAPWAKSALVPVVDPSPGLALNKSPKVRTGPIIEHLLNSNNSRSPRNKSVTQAVQKATETLSKRIAYGVMGLPVDGEKCEAEIQQIMCPPIKRGRKSHPVDPEGVFPSTSGEAYCRALKGNLFETELVKEKDTVTAMTGQSDLSVQIKEGPLVVVEPSDPTVQIKQEPVFVIEPYNPTVPIHEEPVDEVEQPNQTLQIKEEPITLIDQSDPTVQIKEEPVDVVEQSDSTVQIKEEPVDNAYSIVSERHSPLLEAKEVAMNDIAGGDSLEEEADSSTNRLTAPITWI